MRDPLTGLYNRRFFEEALAQHVETARRYERELTLVLFDLDRFKQLNDACGHEAGDEALRVFADRLGRVVRKADLVCRIGGDEFAVILPETSLSNARILISRIYQGLDAVVLGVPGCPIAWRLSVSAGAAAWPTEQLFASADRELMETKRAKHRLFPGE